MPENIENRNPDEKLEHASYESLGIKWVSACNLKQEDRVLLSDGSYGTVESISLETLSTPETTYNFEVADYHTYYVGVNEILCHNKCRPTSPKQLKDNYLKQNGVDAHDFKKRILGKKAPIAKYDIYIDTVDDMIWLGTKGKEATKWVETFISFVELIGGV